MIERRMASTHEQRERPYPGRAEIRALVGGLGPTTLFDLFEEYGVPEVERFRLIEEVLGLLIVQGRPAGNLASWFVQTLEGRCRIFIGIREPEEEGLAETSGFSLVGRVEYLCQASQEEVFRDPRRAVVLAERAVELADRIGAEEGCGADVAAEQRVLARAWRGNALRVSGNLHEAERTFRQALDLLELGVPEPARARVWSLLGSLRVDQGRFDEAGPPLDKSLKIYRRLRIESEECAVRIKLAHVEGLAGRPDQATQILLEVLEREDQVKDPRLQLIMHHDLLTWMLEAGRTEEAIERFEASRELYDRQGQEPRLRLRRRWLEGRIAAALGDLSEAREAFEEVREAAIVVPSPYACASVSLELALVLLREGDWDRVQALSHEMLAFFRSQNIHHYLLAAIQLLQRSAEERTMTVGLISEIQRYFQKSWKSPEVRFESAEPVGGRSRGMAPRARD